MTDIGFLLKALELKDEKRTGWELRNIENPESVADHSWNVALLCLVYSDQESVETDTCVRMALLHDLAEYQTGDLVTRADSEAQQVEKDDKHIMETEAMEKISSGLENREIMRLWNEYEKRDTPEAKFVKDMDMIDMCLTALKYEKQKRYDSEEENENFQEYDNLDEFFATTEPRLNTETGKQLFQEIRHRYKEVK